MSLLIYLLVGGTSFLANMLVFSCLLFIFDIHWLTSNICAFFIGAILNYLLCIRFVFNSVRFKARGVELSLTLVVSGIGVAVESALIYLGYEVLEFHIIVVKLVAAGLVFFWNFASRRFLIFGAVKYSDRQILNTIKRAIGKAT